MGGGGGRMWASQTFAYLNHQCCMVIPGSGYCMGMLDRGYRMVMLGRGYRMGMLGRGYRYSKLIYAGPSQCRNFRQEYIFFLINIFIYLVRLLVLCTFLYTRNLTTLSFSVFLMVSLKILTLLS